MRASILVFSSIAALAVFAAVATAVSLNLGVAAIGPEQGALRDGDRTVPGTVWFQGFLADGASGEPVDATCGIVVQMYSAESGGTSLWGPETHAATTIQRGWFNIELGKTVPLPTFSSPPYYLQLTVNGEMLAPRLKLASVPSALRSGTADAADADWTISGNDLVSAVSGNVGIGDATPDAKLDVLKVGLGGTAIAAHADGPSACGVYSEGFRMTTGDAYGVFGVSDSTGVCGVNAQHGSRGELGSLNVGVRGWAGTDSNGLAGKFEGRVFVDGGTETGTLNAALHAESHDYIAVRGVAARAEAGDSLTAGVCGETAAGGGVGVYGAASGFSDQHSSYGVKGEATSGNSAGVYGVGVQNGVMGKNSASGAAGILGSGQDGVYGASPSGFAGNFDGDVHVSGELGVGTDTPEAKLDVSDVVRVRGATWPAPNTGKSMELAYEPSVHRGYIQVYNRDGAGSWGNLWLGNGNVGIGATDYSYRLDVGGNIRCVDLVETSDDRLKDDVRTIEGALDALEGVRGVSFEWNEESATAGATPGERGIGVLAEDVQRAFPELVSSPEGSRYKSVDYAKLTAVLIEAVKELRKENRALEGRIAELERAMP